MGFRVTVFPLMCMASILQSVLVYRTRSGNYYLTVASAWVNATRALVRKMIMNNEPPARMPQTS